MLSRRSADTKLRQLAKSNQCCIIHILFTRVLLYTGRIFLNPIGYKNTRKNKRGGEIRGGGLSEMVSAAVRSRRASICVRNTAGTWLRVPARPVLVVGSRLGVSLLGPSAPVCAAARQLMCSRITPVDYVQNLQRTSPAAFSGFLRVPTERAACPCSLATGLIIIVVILILIPGASSTEVRRLRQQMARVLRKRRTVYCEYRRLVVAIVALECCIQEPIVNCRTIIGPTKYPLVFIYI